MIIDSTHDKWRDRCGMIAALALATYAVYAFFAAAGVRGGSIPGLVYGAAGAGLVVFECLLGLRRKYPASPIGRVQTWMRAHIWLGLLSLVLILLHSGFRWGSGLSAVMMWLLMMITASGILGMALQHFLPRRMTGQVTKETVFDQIPTVIRALRAEATERVEWLLGELGNDTQQDVEQDVVRAGGKKFYFREEQRKSAAEKAEEKRRKRRAAPHLEMEEPYRRALRARYLQHVRPFLSERPSRSIQRLFEDESDVKAYFQHLRRQMPLPAHPVLDDLEDICDERRQLVVQERLHRNLHGWLYVHVPLSMAFLILIVIHVFVSLKY